MLGVAHPHFRLRSDETGAEPAWGTSSASTSAARSPTVRSWTTTAAITVGKAPTTPGEPTQGFFASIAVAAEHLGLTDRALLDQTDRLAHGTTAGTNAVVTRTGARVGLLATKGHADAIRIMDNTGRATGAPLEQLLHPPSSSLPAPFVEHGLEREITERIDYAGDVVVPLDEEELLAATSDLVQRGVDALAVCFLWSFMNPAHELRAAELIAAEHPGLHVSLSHAVAPRVGEYPRTATTILNAYIGPIMSQYTQEIESRARDLGYRHDVLFMQCNGGLARGARARATPILTLQSGPVAGVIATGEFGLAIGAPGRDHHGHGWDDVRRERDRAAVSPSSATRP